MRRDRPPASLWVFAKLRRLLQIKKCPEIIYLLVFLKFWVGQTAGLDVIAYG
jgi:hypothetical protein